jgi:UDP:flavonoid glycosyltransferase YjiC (YdhE family)
MHFGKPMILLPLFWDQYDNAQRMDELGFGVRLATYAFTDEEMDAALATVLAPDKRAELAAIGERVRARDGLVHGADVIERVARDHVDRTGDASA